MWRSKKFIFIAALLATVVLAGSIGGIALAQTGTGDDSQPRTILDRVAEILVGKGVNVTSEQLKDAFIQAQSDMRTEALKNRLQSLVGEDKITQSEADQYLEWWQAKPDVALKFGFGEGGGFRGMGRLRGWGGPCVPTEQNN